MATSTDRRTVDAVDRRVFLGWLSDASRPWLAWACIGLGVLALVLGWIGVSGEVLVAKQLPYLASGGLVGVSLLVLGSRLLMVDDLRRGADRLEALERQVADLHAVLVARADAAPATPAASNGLLALTDGTTYHRAGCPMLADKEGGSRVTQRDVSRRGLTPCPLCEPVPANH